MTSRIPAGSILKRPEAKKKVQVTDEQKAQAEKDKKNLNIALQHAYRIQYQKDAEALILDAIVTLLEFPPSTPFSPSDAASFLRLIKPFQPSDFASLVEERRIDGRCGYALCPNSPRSTTVGSQGAWKLSKNASDWCSTACAKKAFYVKAQLSEIPAWERAPEQQPDIQLHEDDQPRDEEAIERRAIRTARVNEWRRKIANNEELAMERGETVQSFRPNQVMTDMVVEKKPANIKAPIRFQQNDQIHDAIEGYQPKAKFNLPARHKPRDSDDDEEECQEDEYLDDDEED